MGLRNSHTAAIMGLPSGHRRRRPQPVSLACLAPSVQGKLEPAGMSWGGAGSGTYHVRKVILSSREVPGLPFLPLASDCSPPPGLSSVTAGPGWALVYEVPAT